MIGLLTPILKSLSGNLVTVNERSLTDIMYSPGPYLCELEIRVISWLCQRVKGDYIEIGVNQGFNAVNVCRNNPGKMIYGVDWVNETTMPNEQRLEWPTALNVGKQCQGMNNFTLFLENSRTANIPPVGMVFIDGDHSYAGVKADTENVLRQVKPGTLIVWHDYQADQKPHYQVKDYIDAEVKLPLFRIDGTWLIGGVV